ncbi:MAG TPA: terminase gpA endonuclease subunit [Sedimentisphaerales bacterium]|nr:terminase gpA endonuclease subunit [Sedimentisphaerales bacterium]
MNITVLAYTPRPPAAPHRDPEVFYFTPPERRVFKKKERLTVSQWAERHRVVTNGPMTGKWRNDVTPYLVEPMDTIGLPWVRRVILCFAPQTGKTQVAFNFLGYAIDQDPGPAMYVMPDEKITKRISRRRILPMFRGSPRIADLLSQRADDTTALAVHFQNGMDFMMAWATSAAELSSESIRYLIRDELDKFPEFSGKEADPLALAEIRTNAYPYTKKIIDLSTPTTDSGYIGKAIEHEADEVRDYHVPCPVCREEQIMVFGRSEAGVGGIVWPQKCRDPRDIIRGKLAHYQCRACGMLWDDYQRTQAVRRGRWIARVAKERPVAVGFHLPSWYSPFVSLSEVAAAFLRGQEDPGKLMVFVTQHAAEVWRETIIPKKESGVLEKKTDIPGGVVPADAVALTCGIDVQKLGFWFVVRAWAEDLTSWLIQYGYMTAWADLEALVFNTRYPVQGSADTMGIWRTAIDTGGGETESNEWTRTEEIYQWVRSQQPGRVFGTKGATHVRSLGLKRIKITKIDVLPRSNKPIPGGLELRLLDTSQYKALLHWRMERKEGESQRFFLHADTGIDYARQILSEELARDRKGKTYWKQRSKDNHLLDCECLAAACADSEWLPSLKMIAKHLKERTAEARQEKPTPQRDPINERKQVREYSRPGWLDR